MDVCCYKLYRIMMSEHNVTYMHNVCVIKNTFCLRSNNVLYYTAQIHSSQYSFAVTSCIGVIQRTCFILQLLFLVHPRVVIRITPVRNPDS